MQLFILAVGKGRASPENTLTQSWLSRLPQGGSVIEVESKVFPSQKHAYPDFGTWIQDWS